jgi:hypothetical protein
VRVGAHEVEEEARGEVRVAEQDRGEDDRGQGQGLFYSSIIHECKIMKKEIERGGKKSKGTRRVSRSTTEVRIMEERARDCACNNNVKE